MDVQCRSLLHTACIDGNDAMCELLLSYRALTDVVDVFEADPFSYAVLLNQKECYKSLVARFEKQQVEQ
jgi:ankyrin repeat protein